MARTPPIPNEPIGETHRWREWFLHLIEYVDTVSTGGSPWTVGQGGTGVATITGYVKGTGTTPFTSVNSIPYSDISGAPVAGILAIVNRTTDYTLTTGDYTMRCDATSGNLTMTLPATPTVGMVVNIKKIDSTANTVTIAGNGVLIDGASTKVLSSQYATYQMQYENISNTWNIL